MRRDFKDEQYERGRIADLSWLSDERAGRAWKAGRSAYMMGSPWRTERRVLQIVIFLAACVPVLAGSAGMVMGSQMLAEHTGPDLDSHVRYLSGLLCGLGLIFWGLIPAIERRTAQIRMLTSLVVLGGLARLAATLFVAIPSTSMLLAIVMELVVTPLLCLWQERIARSR